jgi:hypothetical protein
MPCYDHQAAEDRQKAEENRHRLARVSCALAQIVAEIATVGNTTFEKLVRETGSTMGFDEPLINEVLTWVAKHEQDDIKALVKEEDGFYIYLGTVFELSESPDIPNLLDLMPKAMGDFQKRVEAGGVNCQFGPIDTNAVGSIDPDRVAGSIKKFSIGEDGAIVAVFVTTGPKAREAGVLLRSDKAQFRMRSSVFNRNNETGHAESFEIITWDIVDPTA